MIPGIDEILAMLMNDEIDIEQANAWIRQHIANAEDTGHLRDLYAGLAMLGMVANANCPLDPVTEIPNGAFKIARAMMEERDK
jgi:hypothetical protein